jgi:peptidoglycan/LPS O-acetylase OafA/YrhL
MHGADTIELNPPDARDGDQGPATPQAPSTLVHEPALDGLRGLAVAAVVAFHLGHLKGGFLGVDLFFVLSGYLITSLLVLEHGRRERIDLPHFWSRRARRLLPALFVLLVGVAGLLALLATEGERARARGDALTTLGYVNNWYRAFSDVGYWDMFGNPSPLDHMWSLAIEEQFYVLWPLIVALVLSRLRVAALGWLAFGGAAVSFGLLALHWSPLDTNLAYYGTDGRIGPMLLGAGLAVIVARRPRRAGPPRAVSELAAVAAIAAMTLVLLRVDGQADGYYRGGLLLFAAAATVVIATVTGGPPGPVARVLSFRPLAALGLISYGVYLWHWPVIVFLTPTRAGVDGWALAAMRVAITLAVSVVSYFVVERPIRRGALRPPRLRLATAGAIALTLAVVLVVTGGRAETVVAGGRIPVEGSDNPVLLYPADIPDGAPRLLLVGDSGVYPLGPELRDQAAEQGVAVATSSEIVCSITTVQGTYRLPDGEVERREPCQERRRELWSDLVDAFDPDVVVYYLANAGGVSDALIDGNWTSDCDPVYDDWFFDAMQQDAALLQRGGAHLVITTSPDPLISVRERVVCRNDLYHDVASSLPDAEVVDLDTFVWDQQDDGVDMFADLIHLSPEGTRLATDWLLPLLTPRLEAAAGR